MTTPKTVDGCTASDPVTLLACRRCGQIPRCEINVYDDAVHGSYQYVCVCGAFAPEFYEDNYARESWNERQANAELTDHRPGDSVE